MNVGILGSGFGLYGYLPSVISAGWTPHILQSSYEKLMDSPELVHLSERVEVASSVENLVKVSDDLVVALPPKIQVELLNGLVGFRGHLFLEKPLAPDLRSHEMLIEDFKLSGMRFSVAYLLKYTSYYEKILDLLSAGNSSIEIRWMINPPGAVWKSSHKSGGGIFNFYAIHFLELLFDAGIVLSQVRLSFSDRELLMLVDKGSTSIFKLSIAFSDDSSFGILIDGVLDILQNNPFGDKNSFGIPDTRIPLLTSYLRDQVSSTCKAGILLEEYIIEFRRNLEGFFYAEKSDSGNF